MIMVPADHYGVVEDLHLAVNHMITELLGARALASSSVAASPTVGGTR